MSTVFGTDVISGLDVSRASHKIDGSSLTASENGWTVESGVWRVMPGPTVKWTGYTAIASMAAGRMGGEDHCVWFDGDDLYDNGTLVGTSYAVSGAGSTIKDFDDKFFIMGDSTRGKNMVYDGNHLRDHGAWQPELWERSDHGTAGPCVYVSDHPGAATINALTCGATTSITTASAHGIAVGQFVYIDSCAGTVELNGNIYEAITGTTGSTLVLDVDSTDFGAYSGTAGRAYIGGCGLEGNYRFYMTCLVKLKDGRVLEGNPRGLRAPGRAYDSFEPDVFTLTPTDIVTPYVKEYWTAKGVDRYYITGTAETDFYPGFRIYRTKTDGYDWYKMYEFYAGDAQVTESSDARGDYYEVSPNSYANQVPKDNELGAVFTPLMRDRTDPPMASVMALAAQRLWMNDVDNPTRLYFTSLDGTDYVPDLNFLTFPDAITAVGSAGDTVVVFSADRMWRVTLLGGVPDVDEIKTPVGTTYGNALDLTDLGLLFVRDDGLWATDGASPPSKVSRPAMHSLSGPVGAAVSGDTVAVWGSESMYVARRTADGLVWHGPSITYTSVDATGGVFYACDANTVYTLFTGAHGAAAFESPTFTAREECKAVRVILDVDGSQTPVVWVNGNRFSDYDGHADESTDAPARRLVRFSIPRLLNHAFTVRVEMSGEAAVYGYWLECVS